MTSYLSTVGGEQGPQHRIATYNKGCRCDDCREAARLARAKYRARAKAKQRRAA